jgi:hypothetical protein
LSAVGAARAVALLIAARQGKTTAVLEQKMSISYPDDYDGGRQAGIDAMAEAVQEECDRRDAHSGEKGGMVSTVRLRQLIRAVKEGR